MSSLIQAKDLEVNRQGKDILQNVSIDIKKKDFITIIGPNGAGKSVLLECLMGTFRPDKGEIEKKNNLSIGYIPRILILTIQCQFLLKILNVKKKIYD